MKITKKNGTVSVFDDEKIISSIFSLPSSAEYLLMVSGRLLFSSNTTATE